MTARLAAYFLAHPLYSGLAPLNMHQFIRSKSWARGSDPTILTIWNLREAAPENLELPPPVPPALPPPSQCGPSGPTSWRPLGPVTPLTIERQGALYGYNHGYTKGYENGERLRKGQPIINRPNVHGKPDGDEYNSEYRRAYQKGYNTGYDRGWDDAARGYPNGMEELLQSLTIQRKRAPIGRRQGPSCFRTLPEVSVQCGRVPCLTLILSALSS
jgi:hypothetical protein